MIKAGQQMNAQLSYILRMPSMLEDKDCSHSDGLLQTGNSPIHFDCHS